MAVFRLPFGMGRYFKAYSGSGTEESPTVPTIHVEGLTLSGDVEIDTDEMETRLGAADQASAAADNSTSGLNGLLKRLLSKSGTNFGIGPYDYIALTYVDAGAADDDRIATAVYKLGGSGGTTVATLTYTYVGSTNNVASITKS